MQPNRLPNDHFLHLADGRKGTDLLQDQYVALLEAAPQTEEEALAVLRTQHHRQERTIRTHRKTLQLNFDPIAPQTEDEVGNLISALDLLPAKDQELIRTHVIDGVPLPELANIEGVSRELIWRRYTRAKARLLNLVKHRCNQVP